MGINRRLGRATAQHRGRPAALGMALAVGLLTCLCLVQPALAAAVTAAVPAADCSAATARPTTPPGPRPGTPVVVQRAAASPPVQVSVTCGDASATASNDTAAATPAASAAATPDKAAPADLRASERAEQAIERAHYNNRLDHATVLGYGLGAGAALLLAIGLVLAFNSGGVAISGHSGLFGGAGRGWSASPALAVLLVAGTLLGLALMLQMQVLDAALPKPPPDPPKDSAKVPVPAAAATASAPKGR